MLVIFYQVSKLIITSSIKKFKYMGLILLMVLLYLVHVLVGEWHSLLPELLPLSFVGTD